MRFELYSQSVDQSFYAIAALLKLLQQPEVAKSKMNTLALQQAVVQRLSLALKQYACELLQKYKALKPGLTGKDVALTTLLSGIADKPEAVDVQSMLGDSRSWWRAFNEQREHLYHEPKVDYSDSIFSTEDAPEESGLIASDVGASSKNRPSVTTEDLQQWYATFEALVARHRNCGDEY